MSSAQNNRIRAARYRGRLPVTRASRRQGVPAAVMEGAGPPSVDAITDSGRPRVSMNRSALGKRHHRFDRRAGKR
jgi:hypothetical protein